MHADECWTVWSLSDDQDIIDVNHKSKLQGGDEGMICSLE